MLIDNISFSNFKFDIENSSLNIILRGAMFLLSSLMLGIGYL